MKKISIIIPYWNGVEKIQKHLLKVIKIAKSNNIFEIIASDDASEDNTVEILKTQFPEVRLIERKINGGFSSNVNTAVNEAKGEIIFLLNSDAEPERNFLEFALPHFDNPQVFSVSCNAGGLWAVGRFENGFFWHNQATDINQADKPHQTLWASGGSGFFRKSLWDELGGLDDLYNPFYVEDIDLGFRATKRGYINIWEPRSKVEHYKEKGVIENSFSKNIISSTSERNILIFIWKNITSPKLISDHKRALFKRLIKHPKYWIIFMRALSKFPKIMEKRKTEKIYAKLTDEEVFDIFQAEK